jgi:hypothetical protein
VSAIRKGMVSEGVAAASASLSPKKKRTKPDTPGRGGFSSIKSTAGPGRHALIMSLTVIPPGIIGSTCSW